MSLNPHTSAMPPIPIDDRPPHSDEEGSPTIDEVLPPLMDDPQTMSHEGTEIPEENTVQDLDSGQTQSKQSNRSAAISPGRPGAILEEGTALEANRDTRAQGPGSEQSGAISNQDEVAAALEAQIDQDISDTRAQQRPRLYPGTVEIMHPHPANQADGSDPSQSQFLGDSWSTYGPTGYPR